MAFRNPLRHLSASGIIGLIRSDQIVEELIGKILTGALIRTAPDGLRWEISSDGSNRIYAFSGSPHEEYPGYLIVETFEATEYADAQYSMHMQTPTTGGAVAVLRLVTVGFGPSATSRASVIAEEGDIGPLTWLQDGTVRLPGLPGAETYASVTVSAARSTPGTSIVTTVLTVPPASYPRMMTVEFAGICVALTNTCTFELLRNGGLVKAARLATANQSAAGSFTEPVAPGASPTLQLVAEGSGTYTVPNDSAYTYLTATLTPA